MTGYQLTRSEERDGGTFGRLTGPGLPVELHTVERPWLDNRRRVSCIPPGTYELRPRWYIGGQYEAVEVADVPDRSHILIHRGNWPRDVEGCICPGMSVGPLRRAGDDAPTWAVLSSRMAFRILLDALRSEWSAGEQTFLTITAPDTDRSEWAI